MLWMWNSLSRGSPASGDSWKMDTGASMFCHNNWCAIKIAHQWINSGRGEWWECIWCVADVNGISVKHFKRRCCWNFISRTFNFALIEKTQFIARNTVVLKGHHNIILPLHCIHFDLCEKKLCIRATVLSNHATQKQAILTRTYQFPHPFTNLQPRVNWCVRITLVGEMRNAPANSLIFSLLRWTK